MIQSRWPINRFSTATLGRAFRLALLMIGFAMLALPAAARALTDDSGDWPMWGRDLSNTRYNRAESKITPVTVSNLKVRWTFAFPDTSVASSQPTVIGDTVYFGGWNGNVYALDVATGKQRWVYSTGDTGQRGTVRVAPVVVGDLVMFGDQTGRFFTLNKANGTLARLPIKLDDHPLVQITGSPVAYNGLIYVPIASREENMAADPKYPCCTFRGSLVAIDITSGAIVWRFYTVDAPQPRTPNSTGVAQSGPSGVGIWSTPAIDPDEGLIYVSTGNSYSPPVSPNSDAILAINLKDGTLRWARQLTQGDWANSACEATPGPNCEGDHGKDLDFGSAPLLFSVKTASGPRKLVTAVQKSGTMYTLDAIKGDVVWQQTIGQSTSYPWGLSYDGTRLYMADTTFEKNGGVYALDPATGLILWHTEPLPCTPGIDQLPADCWSGFMAAATTTPGLVWLGSMDAQMRAFDSATGKVLWSYNTAVKLTADNGVSGHGGSIGPTNATVSGGQVYVMSGYAKWNGRMLDGNILYVFGLDPASP